MAVDEKAPVTTDDAPHSVSDKTLRRLVILGSAALAVLVIGFGVFYYLSQHVNTGPSLVDRTVAAAEKAVEGHPNDISLRITLAQVYQAANRQNDALTQYNVVLKAVPNSSVALASRAGIEYAQNNLAAATRDYLAVVTPSSSGQYIAAIDQIEAAHYWLAVIYHKQGNPAVSAAQDKAALSIDSTDSDAWYLAGQLALEQGAAKTAIVNFNRALSFVPTGWCAPYASMVQAYTKLKETPKAMFYQAGLDRCQNKTDAAKSIYRQLLPGPQGANAMVQLGALAQTTGDVAGAKDWYTKALARDPKNVGAKASLATLKANSSNATGTK